MRTLTWIVTALCAITFVLALTRRTQTAWRVAAAVGIATGLLWAFGQPD